MYQIKTKPLLGPEREFQCAVSVVCEAVGAIMISLMFCVGLLPPPPPSQSQCRKYWEQGEDRDSDGRWW